METENIEEDKKWIKGAFTHKSNKSSDEDDEIGFCGTIEFNETSKRIQRLLDSGVSKKEIISWLPKPIKLLMNYFDRL